MIALTYLCILHQALAPSISSVLHNNSSLPFPSSTHPTYVCICPAPAPAAPATRAHVPPPLLLNTAISALSAMQHRAMPLSLMTPIGTSSMSARVQ